MINTSANVVKYYTYEPFGDILESEEQKPALINWFHFTGQYYDTEIDQYFLRARQYDPNISRFTARDPAFGQYKEPLTLHRYLYCLNDPVNCTDPGGLKIRLIMFSGMFSAGINLMYQVGIVWDDGNVGSVINSNDPQSIEGLEKEWGLALGIPAVGAGVVVYGWTNADTIFYLEGPGISVGGSFGGVIACLGVDYIIPSANAVMWASVATALWPISHAPRHFIAPCLISLPAITSWFKVELTHSGFALRAALRAAPGKNAFFLGPTTVAKRLVRASIPFRLQLCRDQFGSTFASWKCGWAGTAGMC